MVAWYKCEVCGEIIDEFDERYNYDINRCKDCLVTKKVEMYPAKNCM